MCVCSRVCEMSARRIHSPTYLCPVPEWSVCLFPVYFSSDVFKTQVEHTINMPVSFPSIISNTQWRNVYLLSIVRPVMWRPVLQYCQLEHRGSVLCQQ